MLRELLLRFARQAPDRVVVDVGGDRSPLLGQGALDRPVERQQPQAVELGGRRGVARILLGSQATTVLTQSLVPVLICR